MSLANDRVALGTGPTTNSPVPFPRGDAAGKRHRRVGYVHNDPGRRFSSLEARQTLPWAKQSLPRWGEENEQATCYSSSVPLSLRSCDFLHAPLLIKKSAVRDLAGEDSDFVARDVDNRPIGQHRDLP